MNVDLHDCQFWSVRAVWQELIAFSILGKERCSYGLLPPCVTVTSQANAETDR